MASLDAIINVIVNGQNRIDGIINRTDQLQSIIESLSRSPINLTFGNASRELDRFTREVRRIDQYLENLSNAANPIRENINAATDSVDRFQARERRLASSTRVAVAAIARYQQAISRLDESGKGSLSRQTDIENLNAAFRRGLVTVEDYNRFTSELSDNFSELYTLENRLAKANRLNISSMQELINNTNNLADARNRVLEISGDLEESENRIAGVRRTRAVAEENRGTAEGFLRQIQFLNRLADSYTDLDTSAMRTRGALQDIPRDLSRAGVRGEISAFDDLASSVNYTTSAFDKFTIASETAKQTLATIERRRVSVLAEAFSPTFQAGINPIASERSGISVSRTRQIAEDLLRQTPTRSEAGLALMINQLQELRALIPFVDENYGRLTTRIRELNDELNAATGRPDPVQRQITAEIGRQADLLDRVNRANLTIAQQEVVRGRLEEAGSAIQEGNVELARQQIRGLSGQITAMQSVNRQQETRNRLIQDELSLTAGRRRRIVLSDLPQEQKRTLLDRANTAQELLAAGELEEGKRIRKELDRDRFQSERNYRLTLSLAEARQAIIDKTFSLEQDLTRVQASGVEIAGELNKLVGIRNSLQGDNTNINRQLISDQSILLDGVADFVSTEGKRIANINRANTLIDKQAKAENDLITKGNILKGIQGKYNDLKAKGLSFGREEADLQSLISQIDNDQYTANERNIKSLDTLIRKYASFAALKERDLGKTRNFGILGVDFIPISGKLPGGQVVPGSPATRKPSRGASFAMGPAAAPVDRITGPTSSIEEPKKMAGLARSAKLQLQQFVALQLSGLDVSREIAGVEKIINDIQTNRIPLSERYRKSVEDTLATGMNYVRILKGQLSINETITNTESDFINKRNDLNRILLKYNDLKKDGVQFGSEEIELQNLVNTLANDNIAKTTQLTTELGRQVRKFQSFQGLRVQEAVAAGAFTGTSTTPEKLESQRNKLLQEAFGLRGSLDTLEKKGLDVATQRKELEQAITSLKSKQGQITKDNLASIQGEFEGVRAIFDSMKTGVAELKSELVEASKATGFGKSFQDFQEGLKGSRTFFGDQSPAQAIDKIVREFNKGDLAATDKGSGAAVAENIVTTFIKKIRAGLPGAKSASQAFAQAGTDAINEEWEINSPSGFVIKWIKNIINTTKASLASGKSQISAAFADAFDPRELLKSNLSSVQLGDTSALAEKVAGFVSRASSKPSVFRPFARLAGESILSSPAVTEATYRKAYEAGGITSSTLLPVSERRGLRGTPGLPGSGLEAAIMRSAMSRVSATGAFVGPLSGPLSQPYQPPALTGPKLGVPARPAAVDVSAPALVHNAVVTQAQKVTSDTYSMVAKNTFKDFSQRATQIAASSQPNIIEQLKTNARIIGTQVTFELGQVIGGREIWGEFAEVVSDSIKSSVKSLQGRASTAFDFVAGGLPGQQSPVPSFAEQRKRVIDINRRVATELSAEGGYSARFVNPRGRLSSYSKEVFPVEGMLTTPAAAAISAGQRNLRQKISDLFEDISSGINAASGGGGAGLPPRPPVGPGGPAGPGGGDDGPGGFGARLEAAEAEGVEALLSLQELKKPSKATTKQLEILSAVLKDFYVNLDPTADNAKKLNAELRRTTARLDDIVASRAPDADPLVRLTRSPRMAQGISEGLIGGAFPLLFGQGGGAALLGGVGGFAGGFMGGALGFGLSLIGTALGTAFDTAVQSAGELGAALNDTVKVFDMVRERSLFSSREVEKLAGKLEEAGFSSAASILAQQEVINKIGGQGVQRLRDLGESSDRLGRALAELNLQLQAALAGPMAGLLEWVAGIVAESNKISRGRSEVKDVRDRLSGADREEFDRRIEEAEYLSKLTGANPKRITREQSLEKQVEIAREFAARTSIAPPVELKFDTDKLKTELATSLERISSALDQELELLNIGKGFSDQSRNAIREQEDINKQVFEIRKSYEESIRDIRLSIERTVQKEAIDGIKSQNELLKIQGDARIQQIRNATLELASEQGADEYGRRLFEILGQAAEIEVSTQEQIAARKRDLELELQSKALETEIYKADIAKQVAKLNEDTARTIADINKSIRRANEDYDINRFEIEKEIASFRLNIMKAENKESQLQAQRLIDTYENLAPGQALTPLGQKTLENTKKYLNLLQGAESPLSKAEEAVSSAKLPPKRPELAQIGTIGVSTASLEAVRARAISAARALANADESIINLIKQGKLIELKNSLNELADQGFRKAEQDLKSFIAKINDSRIGDEFSGAVESIIESTADFKSVIKALASNGTTAPSEAAAKIIENYRKAGAPDSLIKDLAEIGVQVNVLSLANLEGVRTTNFYTSSSSRLGQEIQSLNEQIIESTKFGTEVEKTFADIAKKGLSPLTEESKALLAEANKLDIFKQKIAVIEGFTSAADILTDSMRGLVEQFFEFGSASEAVKNFAEEMSKRTLSFVLDIGFKPVQENMRKTMLDIAKNLGFDISTEGERQLHNLVDINNTTVEIKDIISRLISGTTGARTPALSSAIPESGTQTARPVSQQINAPYRVNQYGIPLLPGEPTNRSADSYKERGKLVGGGQGGSDDQMPREAFPLPETHPYPDNTIPEGTIRLENIPYVKPIIDSMKDIGSAAEKAKDPLQQWNFEFTSSSAAIQNVVPNLAEKNKQLNTIVPQWGKNLGAAVTGLSLASTAVIGIVGGIQNIKAGGAGNVLSGIGSILTTIGGIGMSAAGMGLFGGGGGGFGANYFNPKTGLGAAGPNFGLANGGVLDDGKLTRFADGGVLQSPTLFSFEDAGVTKTGQAGEAGVEAVMPLKRTKDGRLGVEAELSIPFEVDDEQSDAEERDERTAASALSVPFVRAGGRTGSMTAAQMLQAAAEAGLNVPFMKSTESGGPDISSLDSPIRFETFRVGDLDVVTREEAEEIGRRAEARGATKGAALAQKRLQNSPSTRRATGI